MPLNHLDPSVVGSARSSLAVRIDSHMPAVWSAVHPGEDVEAAFERLDSAATAAADAGLRLLAVVPYTTLNAAHLDALIADLAARGIREVQIEDLDPQPPYDRFHDPQQHMSPEWNRWAIGKARTAAEAHGVTLRVAVSRVSL